VSVCSAADAGVPHREARGCITDDVPDAEGVVPDPRHDQVIFPRFAWARAISATATRQGRTWLCRYLTFALLLLPMACAQTTGDDAAGSRATDPAPALDRNRLAVVVERGGGAEPERFTLVCGAEPHGSHPRPQAACEHLNGLTTPFSPLPKGRACTEVYGGPQTARVDGVWLGEPVHLELSRVNGCRIAQWDRLGPLLVVPREASPTQ